MGGWLFGFNLHNLVSLGITGYHRAHHSEDVHFTFSTTLTITFIEHRDLNIFYISFTFTFSTFIWPLLLSHFHFPTFTFLPHYPCSRLRGYFSLLSRTELLTTLVSKSSFRKLKGENMIKAWWEWILWIWSMSWSWWSELSPPLPSFTVFKVHFAQSQLDWLWMSTISKPLEIQIEFDVVANIRFIDKCQNWIAANNLFYSWHQCENITWPEYFYCYCWNYCFYSLVWGVNAGI